MFCRQRLQRTRPPHWAGTLRNDTGVSEFDPFKQSRTTLLAAWTVQQGSGVLSCVVSVDFDIVIVFLCLTC